MSTPEADIERVVDWLRPVRLCEGLDAEQLAAMAGQMQLRPFVAGETLAVASNEVTEFWVVAEGEIETFMTDARGRESLLGLVRQGETVGEVAILEKSSRSVRFTARTHGTLLVSPAAVLLEWVEAYPSVMRCLFHTLSERFKQVVGLAARGLPSPRLGIVAASRRGRVLAGRLATRLLDSGERLLVWADQPAALKSAGSWPEAVPIQEFAPTDEPLLQQPPAPDVDRRIVVWSPGSDGRMDIGRLQGCDEVLWLLEPRDAAATSQDLRRAPAMQGELAPKLRIVWLLDADMPVAPILSSWEVTRPDLKAPVETSGGSLTRLERQGLDRLVRALRGISVGIALAGGGAKGMAHFGVLRVLEAAGLSFDIMSGTSAGAMAGILYASGMPPESAVATSSAT